MKMKPLIFGLLVLWGAGASSELLACGNKFLSASRGTRFGKLGFARQDAAILVYANPESTLPKAIGDVPVEEILRDVGYRPKTVTDPEQLDLALREGGWDLVLADLADSEPIRWRSEGEGSSAPMVVPVLYQPSRKDLSQAKKNYGRVLKAPFKSMRLLEAIDDAVALLVKARPAG